MYEILITEISLVNQFVHASMKKNKAMSIFSFCKLSHLYRRFHLYGRSLIAFLNYEKYLCTVRAKIYHTSTFFLKLFCLLPLFSSPSPTYKVTGAKLHRVLSPFITSSLFLWSHRRVLFLHSVEKKKKQCE